MTMQCEFKKNGKSCRAYAISESIYCFWHDPASARRRSEARKKGGFNRRIIKNIQREHCPIKTVKDINAILERAINDAQALGISQSQLRTLGYLCQIALKAQELGGLEERVSAIEQVMQEPQEKNSSAWMQRSSL